MFGIWCLIFDQYRDELVEFHSHMSNWEVKVMTEKLVPSIRRLYMAWQKVQWSLAKSVMANNLTKISWNITLDRINVKASGACMRWNVCSLHVVRAYNRNSDNTRDQPPFLRLLINRLCAAFTFSMFLANFCLNISKQIRHKLPNLKNR